MHVRSLATCGAQGTVSNGSLGRVVLNGSLQWVVLNGRFGQVVLNGSLAESGSQRVIRASGSQRTRLFGGQRAAPGIPVVLRLQHGLGLGRQEPRVRAGHVAQKAAAHPQVSRSVARSARPSHFSNTHLTRKTIPTTQAIRTVVVHATRRSTAARLVSGGIVEYVTARVHKTYGPSASTAPQRKTPPQEWTPG
jgi:hypothetical protein